MEYIRKLVAGIGQPVLIVVDTLNRNFGAGDENSTKDMTLFVAGLDKLRLATGACVLTNHHCGHADKTRMRAAISLHNAVDAEYLVDRDGDREAIASLVTTMKCTKFKDGESPKPLSWSWKQHNLPWYQPDGNGYERPMTSVVLTPIDPVEHSKTDNLGDKQRQALEILKELYAKHRQNLTDGNQDPNSAKVLLKDWSSAMKDVDPDSGNRAHIRSKLKSLKLVDISGGYAKPL